MPKDNEGLDGTGGGADGGTSPGLGVGPGGGLGGSAGGVGGGLGEQGATSQSSAAGRSSAPQDLTGLDAGDGSDGPDDIEALRAENAELKARLVDMEAALASAEAMHELERLLLDAGVIDLETAMALASPRLMSGEPASAVADALAQSKPFLFASAVTRPSAGRSAGSSMSGRSALANENGLDTLASEARRTGDRRALTRYLRHRRRA